MIEHRTYEPACILRSCILNECQGDEHQCLSKDDRHHVSSEQLQGDILTGTTYLLIAYNTLSILYGHLADTLYQYDGCAYYQIENDNLNEEHYQTTTSDSGEARGNLLDERLWQASNNTDHNDQ